MTQNVYVEEENVDQFKEYLVEDEYEDDVDVDEEKNDTGFLLNFSPSVAFRPYEPLESFFVRN